MDLTRFNRRATKGMPPMKPRVQLPVSADHPHVDQQKEWLRSSFGSTIGAPKARFSVLQLIGIFGKNFSRVLRSRHAVTVPDQMAPGTTLSRLPADVRDHLCPGDKRQEGPL
jgi:hypothetical protein